MTARDTAHEAADRFATAAATCGIGFIASDYDRKALAARMVAAYIEGIQYNGAPVSDRDARKAARVAWPDGTPADIAAALYPQPFDQF